MTMRTQRRALLLGALATPALATGARAAWPERSIRIVIPYPPGGASDTTARLITEPLTRALGQNVVVDNRPGANGAIALENVATSPNDGHTLLMGNLGPNAINPVMRANLPFDAVRSFAPIVLANKVPMALMVRADHPARDFARLVAMAREAPGRIGYGSAGNGSASHLAGEMLKVTLGIDLLHVPYRGDAPAITDVLSGALPCMLSTTVSVLPQMRSGRMRVLGVASAQRLSSMPDVPTFLEQGVAGYEVSSWNGLFAPAGTPRPVIERVNAEASQALRIPEVTQRLEMLGAASAMGTPEEFATFLRAELDRWAEVVRVSGAKAED
ncbi:Bug family tripartite tricarboxylate transporter substrate binding protein [Roseococcus sp.]|uniref:Bug family tripartite tricarboxylate transporter substrate binding protein n=1 Tax=Roseococcus sp. TaxID=2109646 RepID=UPI003BAB444F